MKYAAVQRNFMGSHGEKLNYRFSLKDLILALCSASLWKYSTKRFGIGVDLSQNTWT